MEGQFTGIVCERQTDFGTAALFCFLPILPKGMGSNAQAVGLALVVFLAHDLHIGLFLNHQRMGRDAGGQKHIGANGAACADKSAVTL